LLNQLGIRLGFVRAAIFDFLQITFIFGRYIPLSTDTPEGTKFHYFIKK
jgi:hypothetical protein